MSVPQVFDIVDENEDDHDSFSQNHILGVPKRIEGKLRIHNVLALALLECDQKAELDEAVKYFLNATYTPDQFPALRIEVRGPLTGSIYTVSLFDGGRIQSAGGVMPREAGMCMKQVAKRLAKCMGIKVKFRNFEVHNLLAVVDLGHPVDLWKLYSLAPGVKEYEPSKFPALRVTIPVPQTGHEAGEHVNKRQKIHDQAREAARINHDKTKKKEVITTSIFSNGKMNFVGGKSVKSIVSTIDELQPFIEACS